MKDPLGVQTITEVERKFDVDDGFVLPALNDLPGVAKVSVPRDLGLDATYFDVADLRLLRHRITLRRRTGGDDAGWHLKRLRPDGDRYESRYPLGRSASVVPRTLRAEVEVVLRGADVVPVIRLRTRRRVARLTTANGTVLVEVADDRVTADLPGQDGQPGGRHAWREVEVELLEGTPKLLSAIGKRLVEAGAHASTSRSKLERALAAFGLGDSQEPTSRRPVPNPAARRRRPGRAGDVVLDHLSDLVGRLSEQDPPARADVPDGVHQLRVTTRKLRSFLGTFRPLFDRAVTDPLRQELAWLGSQLGAARDAEVIRDHLLEDLDRQPAEVVLGPVRDRVVTTMEERHRAAYAELLVALASPRYFALLDALDALATAPPLTERARGRAQAVLLPLVDRTWRRAQRLVRVANRTTDVGQRDLLLHDVRKAAKRARYAADALVVAYGRPARVFASRMKAVQEALGDHQDSVVIRREILQLAADAEQAGETTFTYGCLHSREEQRGALSEAEFTQRWERAARPAMRAWLQ